MGLNDVKFSILEKIILLALASLMEPKFIAQQMEEIRLLRMRCVEDERILLSWMFRGFEWSGQR